MRRRCPMTILAATVLAAALAAGGCSRGTPGQTNPAVTEQSQSETGAAPAERRSGSGEAAENRNGAEAAENAADGESQTGAMEATDAEYLKTWFGVELSEDSLDGALFSKALQSVAGRDASAIEGKLNWTGAVQAAVRAADYEELALSYPQKKVADRLKHYGVSLPGDSAYGADIACALDVSLITRDNAKKAAAGDAITVGEAEKLLMNIAQANGDGRNYLGMARDPDIYARLDHAWNSFLLFDDGRLAQVGKEAVLKQVTTGYGIKSAAYDARFLPNLTLQYSHSDIKHAHQLMGLLNSENMDAKVQLEPKVSIYQYLSDWGPIPESTPTYEVKKTDGLNLVNAVEYDMELEFNNTQDMMRFDSVIKEYAKKNAGNEDARGLIYESWWQPLYSTARSHMPSEDYHQIYDCVVTNGVYSIHPFALPENKDEVVKKLTALAGGLEVKAVPRYCNTAFYNYLKGDDYQ